MWKGKGAYFFFFLSFLKIKRKANVKRGTQCSARFLTHEFHLSSVPARRRPLVDVKIKDTKCVCESVNRTRQGRARRRRRRRPREGREEKRFWITQHKSIKRTCLRRHLLSTACNRRRLIARALNKNMCRTTTTAASQQHNTARIKKEKSFLHSMLLNVNYTTAACTLHNATYCVM